MQYEVIAAIIDVLRCYHEVVRVGIVSHISTRDRLHEGGTTTFGRTAIQFREELSHTSVDERVLCANMRSNIDGD